jgi:RNA polymerase sigma-70 factor (ECF subfamily)
LKTRQPAGVDTDERDLIKDLYPSLRRFASMVRAPGEDGNDLVQEALVRTLRRKGSLIDIENPGAYLRRTILNLARSNRRRDTRQRQALARLGTPENAQPTYQWDLEELRLVPPKARAVLYLRIIEGRSHEEIAGLLGCSHVSVRVAASRGRRQLEALLSKEVRDAIA